MLNLIDECVWLNKQLKKQNLVKLTWGNASINLPDHTFCIKPSGVDYESLIASDMSIIDKNTCLKISGKKESVDTKIHYEIYKVFPLTTAIVHTHSKNATIWAQSNKSIPIFGTTHADYFCQDIPVIDEISSLDLNDYESNLGKMVVNWCKKNKTTPLEIKSLLIPFHGTLSFGNSSKNVLENAIVLEEIAEMALYNNLFGVIIKNKSDQKELFKFHYERKNGPNKYYGQ